MKNLFITLILISELTLLKSQGINIPIVPSPQFIIIGDGSLKIEKITEIIITGKETENNLFAAQIIQKTLQDFNKINPVIKIDTNDKTHETRQLISGKILLEETDSLNLINIKYPKFNKEGYYLTIDMYNITIKAFSSSGLFYGAMSLIQWLEKSVNDTLHIAEIIDWPDLKIRGVSDDISRGQVSTIENFKKIIQNLARYKMNTYMPYLEDMLQFDAYPTIGKNRGALSKDEVKELVKYAKDYKIEIIPIFQTLGHYENILSQPEFLKYAEFPGAASLNVSSDSTYIFLENMLKEVFDIFPSEYIHIGADESYDVGLGKSKSLVEKYNKSNDTIRKNTTQRRKVSKKNTEENDGITIVHANHYKRVYEICKKYNRKIMMYSDIVLQYPKIIELIPKDITMVDWHYNPADDYNSTIKFKEAGFKFIVSPSVWNFYSSYPVNELALPNIKHLTESGISNNSVGMINSNWGDYGAETFKELIYFGYAWSAQCAWNIKASDISTFSRNYFYDFYGFDDQKNTHICQAFSNPLNQIPWHEVWRHPLLPFSDPPSWEGKRNIVVKENWMEWTTLPEENVINELQDKAIKNKDNYDIFKFLIKLNKWYTLKINTQELLFKISDKRKTKSDTTELRTTNYKLINDLLVDNINQLTILRDEYDQLWLKYYKKDNLNMIDDKFNRIISYFKEIKSSLNKNELPSPVIKSDWIYLKINDIFAKEAIFRKEFLLESKPDSALLQLLGDTHAKIFINGQYIDEVYARSSLSLLVDYKRIKLIDITKYLKDSLNSIEICCENFNNKDMAGCNIYSEIYLKGKSKVLVSDDSWYTKEPGAEKWHKAVVQKYSKFVIAPNFNTRRTSWIER